MKRIKISQSLHFNIKMTERGLSVYTAYHKYMATDTDDKRDGSPTWSLCYCISFVFRITQNKVGCQ